MSKRIWIPLLQAVLFLLALSDVRAQTSDEPTAVPEPAPNGSASPGDTGDVVETIDSGDASAAPEISQPSLVAPAVVESNPDRFELHGWARQSLELGFANDAFRAAQPDPWMLSYDPLVARTQLFARARYSHSDRFEANLSGVIGYNFFEQTTDQTAKPFNGFNGQARRGEVVAQLRELFLAFYSRRLDVRLGQQRVSWGRADFISPNDVVNPRDMRDPFISESELRVQPSLLARADIDLDFGVLQLLWSPVFTPDRFDVYGSNWAALQPSAPAGLRGLINVLDRSLDPSAREGLQRLLSATRMPSTDLTQPALGARFSWSAGGVDISHYYHFGYDGPFVVIDPALGAALAATDFSHAGLANLQPLLQAIDAGQHPLDVSYVRRHHVGIDAATTVGPLSLRLEAAYQSRRVFFDSNFQGFSSPSLSGVLALEYASEDAEKVLLVEALYIRVLNESRVPLLFYDRNTLGGMLLVRWPFGDHIKIELRGMGGLKPRTFVVQPEIHAKFEAFIVSLGLLWLDGDKGSFGAYFSRNTEVYVKAKCLF